MRESFLVEAVGEGPPARDCSMDTEMYAPSGRVLARPPHCPRPGIQGSPGPHPTGALLARGPCQQSNVSNNGHTSSLPPAPGPPPGLSESALAKAAARLRDGGTVAFPTETVYGLGADALNPSAVERVFRLKGRPSVNPLIVHVSGVEMARRHAVDAAGWSARAEALARAFWPGPLTMVLPRAAGVPQAVTAGRDTVAVRCPDHPAALALLFAFDGPLVGPSANRSGGVSPTCAEHVRAAWLEDDVLVIDGGPCSAGIESTVLLVPPGGRARVLRPGPIGGESIRDVLGEPVEAAPPTGSPGGGLLSPGMMPVHYAPRTRAVIVEHGPGAEPLRDALDDLLDGRGAQSGSGAGRAVVLSHRLTLEAEEPGVWRLIRMPGSASGYAARLYAALREADAMGADLIAIERPPGPEAADSADDRALWVAIADRLARATAR